MVMPIARIERAGDETGSVLPLVLGMVVGVLLLGAGVSAATSAFLAHQRLQNACDGAAAAAADATLVGYYATPSTTASNATDAAEDYLRPRRPDIAVQVVPDAAAVEVTCTATDPITFGALFGVGDLTQSVRSVGRVAL